MKIEDDINAGKALKKVSGNIVFKDVSFGHSDDKQILKNINLDIKF